MEGMAAPKLLQPAAHPLKGRVGACNTAAEAEALPKKGGSLSTS